MSNNSKQYGEGDIYKVFHKKNNRLLATVKIPEAMCKAGLDRFLFFKYNIPPGEYRVKKVGSIGD